VDSGALLAFWVDCRGSKVNTADCGFSKSDEDGGGGGFSESASRVASNVELLEASDVEYLVAFIVDMLVCV